MSESKRAIKILEVILRFLKETGDITLLGDISDNAQKQGVSPNPFRILIGTVLSARNRDELTTIAVKQLFDEGGFDTPEKIAGATLEVLEGLIKKSGFYRIKASRIKEISKILIKDHGSKVPKNMDLLLALPGVGRKTANCVRVYAFNIPCIPVDTHVHRIPNRLGLIKTKKPEKSELALMELYPEKYWTSINNGFITFGKLVCKPISPNCSECPLEKDCPKLIIPKASKKKKKPKKR